MKKRKKGSRIIPVILLVLVLGLAGLYLWQRENIRALYKVLTTDSETIAQDLEQVRQDHLKELEEAAHVAIRVQPVTTQQSEDLLNGKVTVEEVQQQMGYVPQDPEQTVTQPSGKEDIINQCIAELYAYKAEVMGYLGGLKQTAIGEWNALQPSQRTAVKKAEIISAGIGKCYNYEATVDGKVQEILARYRPKLTELGEDTAPIDILWKQYCDEKEAEKSYYFDQYVN